MLPTVAVVLVLLLSPLAGSGHPTPRVRPSAPTPSAAGPVDLAATALTPADPGLAGFLHVGAFVEPLAGEAANVAAYRGHGTTAAEIAAKLREFGWRRQYVSTLGLPGSTNSGRITRLVRSYVAEYADASGAAAGFVMLEDESLVPSAHDVPTNRAFGEQSEATRDHGVDGAGRPFRSLDLTFRTGPLVAGVTMIDYPSATFTDPDLAPVEALAGLLESRLASPAVGPTFGDSVLRLGDDGHRYVTYDDAYYRRAGQDLPLADESSQSAAARTQSYDGALDVYQLWQGVKGGAGAPILYSVTLYRFPSESAAAAWLGDLAGILGRNPYYGDLQPVSAPALGDQTTALAFTPGGRGGSHAATLVAVRIGPDVARVQLIPGAGSSPVSAAAVVDLATKQAVCLQRRACPEATTLPEAARPSTPTGQSTPASTPGT